MISDPLLSNVYTVYNRLSFEKKTKMFLNTRNYIQGRLKQYYRPPGKAVHWGPYLHNHS
jgi:hypothetical protein